MGAFTAAIDLTPFCANDNESLAAFLLDVRGQAAALSGVPASANPYRAGSFEAVCWSAGWMAGMRDMQPPFPAACAQGMRSRVAALEPCAG